MTSYNPINHNELRNLLNGRHIHINRNIYNSIIRINVNKVNNVKINDNTYIEYTQLINNCTAAPLVRDVLTIIDAPINLELKFNTSSTLE